MGVQNICFHREKKSISSSWVEKKKACLELLIMFYLIFLFCLLDSRSAVSNLEQRIF